jgi:hypothetical protein
MFAIGDSFQDKAFRRFHAADKFNDDIDVRIGQDVAGITGQPDVAKFFWQGLYRKIGDAVESKGYPGFLCQALLLVEEGISQPLADGTETDYANMYFFHSFQVVLKVYIAAKDISRADMAYSYFAVEISAVLWFLTVVGEGVAFPRYAAAYRQEGRHESTNSSESNRFQDECQNLTGDIFMARSLVLVYSICLVTLC